MDNIPSVSQGSQICIQTPKRTSTEMDTGTSPSRGMNIQKTEIVKELSEKINKSNATLEELKDNLAKKDQAMTFMEFRIISLEQENKELRRQVELLDAKTKRNNVIIDGLAEDVNKNTENVVKDFFKTTLGIEEENINISNSYRLGRSKPNGRPRSILACLSPATKRTMWSKVTNLRNKNIWIRDDLPPHMEDRRRVMSTYLSTAKCLDTFKKNSSLNKDELKIYDKIYTVTDVRQIPQAIQDEACSRTVKKSPDVHVHFTHANPLSNFHPTRFTVDNVTYTCTEQMYQAKKAQYCNDIDAMVKILKAETPIDMKRIGDSLKVGNPDDWSTVGRREMYHANFAKFQQDQRCQDYLLDTGVKILGEASPNDGYWGIGVGLRHTSVLDNRLWPGDNEMGHILMDIRKKLSQK